MNEMMASTMSSLASLLGGEMGWAILALALCARLALLPLTLWLARKMLANQQKIKALQPEVDAIKARLATDPKAMFAAISALYKVNGAHMLDRSSLLGAMVQLPVFGLLYKVVSNASSAGSFLWIKNLATPDTLLTAIVLVLTAAAAYYFPSMAPETAMAMIVVQVLVTAFILWKLSAAMGLYWAASASVGVVQSFILRHEQRRRAAPGTV